MVSPRSDVVRAEILSADAPARRRAILVLGMHRSGTSPLTKLLGLCGGGLPKRSLEPNFANTTGYWEPAEIVAIHDEMLSAVGSFWDDTAEFPLEWLSSSKAQPFKLRLAAAYREAFGDSNLALLKDPRICRFVPLWVSILEAMGIEPLFIIPVRNPLEVAASLKAREDIPIASPLRARGGVPEAKAMLLWLRHFLEAERHSRGFARSFVSYEQLLGDWRATIAKIGRDLAIDWPSMPADGLGQAEAFLSPQLRHHLISADEIELRSDISPWLKDSFRWAQNATLGRLSGAGELDRIRQAMHTADATFLPILAAHEASLAEQGATTAVLEHQLGEREATLTIRLRQGRELEARLAERESAFAALALEQEQLRASLTARAVRERGLEACERALYAVYRSTSWRLTAPLRWIGLLRRRVSHVLVREAKLSWRMAVTRSTIPLKRRRWARVIAKSGLFDAGWYLETYCDIAATGVDPLEHYLVHGAAEKRNPSPRFDTAAYLLHNPDVAARGVNPLLHYVMHGRSEGRTMTGTEPAFVFDAPILKDIRSSVNPSGAFEPFDSAIAAGLKPRVKAIAFYLPQFHSIPENDQWWGKGFTEWRNVARGSPRFAGHYQPRIPRDLGFYDLTHPDVIRRQVELAKAAGLAGFCFYFYWFDGKRLLEKPINLFLADSSIDFPFCIMWANENWTRLWDGFEKDILIAQSYRQEDETSLLEQFHRHFVDSRYIRVNERPLLIIYRPSLIPNAAETFARWKKHYVARYGYAPLLVGVQAFGMTDPGAFGLDGAMEFPPHLLAHGLQPQTSKFNVLDPQFKGLIFNYEDVIKRSLDRAVPDYPLIRAVMPDWDNDARRQGAGTIYHGSTPAKYGRWLGEMARYAADNPTWSQSFVFINAWNEWAEAAYLEPDVRYGSAYLNATARALAALPASEGVRGMPLLLVGHDAYDHGAQRNLRAMGEVLVRRFGIAVEFVLLEGGPLLASYQRIAPCTVLSSPLSDSARSTFLRLHDKGFRLAIANTTVAGKVVAEAKGAGLRVLSLVHELPGLIGDYGLLPAAKSIAANSELIVFASELVRDKFRELSGAGEERCRVRPQGLYRKEIAADPGARARIRAELGLPAEARIVLNVGYGDQRKGFDLFARMAQKLSATESDLYFVWIGAIAPDMAGWAAAPFAPGRAVAHLLTPGQRDEVRDYYNAADLFMLTSREDPFPSVVLEALAAGLPVVGFARATGCEDLIARHGSVVPAGDLDAACAAVKRELEPGRQGGEAVDARRREIATRFDYADYCFWLLQLLDPALRRVSVVVPNYNHEAYLADRLSSIFRQRYPVYEVIVLDDASSDHSVEVIETTARAAGRDITLAVNARNGGRLPDQWRKGLALSSGDYIWVAESDDICDEAFLGETVGAADKAGAGLCFCDSWQIDGEGRKIGTSYILHIDDIVPGTFLCDFVMPGRQFLESFLGVKNVIMNMSGVLWRRSALAAALTAASADIDQFKLAADWRLYVEACRQGSSFAYIARSLNGHRRHEGGITASLDSQSHLDEVRRMQTLVAGTVELGVDRQWMARRHVQEARRYLGLPDPPDGLGAEDFTSCERQAYRLGVSPIIHEKDPVLNFLLSHIGFKTRADAIQYYFDDGRRSCETLRNLLTALGRAGDRPNDSPMTLMEFAPGFGCLTRHWGKALPQARITAGDPKPEGIRFIGTYFGISTALLTGPDSEAGDSDKFDVIFALAFFSHVSAARWGMWLKALYSRLKPGGDLIFTAHGLTSAKFFDNPEIPPEGIWHQPMPEAPQDEDSAQTIVEPHFVERQVRAALGEEVLMIRPALWWGHQDAYVVRRLNS